MPFPPSRGEDAPSRYSFTGIIKGILEVVPGGVLRAKKTAYSDDANTGWWIGVDTDGLAKLNIGNASWYLKWTGTKIELKGDISFASPESVSAEYAIKWLSGTTVVAYVGAWLATGANYLRVFVDNVSGHDAKIEMWTSAGAGHSSSIEILAEQIPTSGPSNYAGIELIAGEGDNKAIVSADHAMISGGLMVGDSSTEIPEGEIACTGTISTDSNSTRWDLGGYVATAPGATGYVAIVINGTTYKLLAAT